MSTPFTRDPDKPHDLIPFNEKLLDQVTDLARDSDRKRHIIRFHELPEPFQRMLNAIEPGTYTRPHRHLDPAKAEIFVALRGSALIIRFGDEGEPLEGVVVAAEGPVRGIEIPIGAWHCLLSLESGTVLFEAKEGPYSPASDKSFAPWAPPETDIEGGKAFIEKLRKHFASWIPQVI
ncbi:MAG: WbuC family cupin fold metalloprotein [Chloroflexia bacterium]